MVVPLGILPLDAFRNSVESARLPQYRYDPRNVVRSRAAFEEMQGYLIDLYDGVEAQHSFEDRGGRVVDCIPVDQQPSLRGSTEPVSSPPDLRTVLEGRAPEESEAHPLQPRSLGRRDRHGNNAYVPEGTIPVHRTTMADLARFDTVDDFTSKNAGPVIRTLERAERERAEREFPSEPDPDSGRNHRYAYVRQAVSNIGGHNSISIYAPAVNSDQIFSLAQHWYSGGAGNANQTLEVGWQVYPTKYGHAHPVLFIYWTADNYQTTGAYNLDKPGFVQTNNAWTIGGSLSPVSTQGGQQFELDITTYLFQNNWWIYVGGITAADALGYYPTSLYSGGQMASGATDCLFGGETVTGAVSWGPMGSGAFASAGWQQAAYQRNIYYFSPTGGAQWVAATEEQPSPACYTTDLGSADVPWGVYFFFGGSGGGNC